VYRLQRQWCIRHRARAELVAVFAEKFDIENDVIEELVEDTLAYLVEGYDLVLRYKALAK